MLLDKNKYFAFNVDDINTWLESLVLNYKGDEAAERHVDKEIRLLFLSVLHSLKNNNVVYLDSIIANNASASSSTRKLAAVFRRQIISLINAVYFANPAADVLLDDLKEITRAEDARYDVFEKILTGSLNYEAEGCETPDTVTQNKSLRYLEAEETEEVLKAKKGE